MAMPVAALPAKPRITDGVASGDVTDTGAVIWSRCDRPAHMIVEYATTAGFRDPRRVAGPVAQPATDFTAQTLLTGLPPGQTVFYRVRFEDLAGPKTLSAPVTGRLRTAPDHPADVTFAWGGDMCGAGWGINPDWGGLRMFDTLRRAAPDLLIHCGDRIYADKPLKKKVSLSDGTVWRNLLTPAKSKVAETLDEYRGNYRYNLMDVHYRRFSAEVPQLITWDDHEVINNWWPGRSLARNKRYETNEVDVLVRRARQAFFEYTPMRRNAADPGRIYRSVRYGPMMEVFLIDGRSYRSPNSRNRQAAPDSPANLLGPAQTAWLKAMLARSDALWKVIVCDVPLATYGSKRRKRYDKWANGDHGDPLGRERELADILATIKSRGIENTVWLVADVHYAAAHHFHPDRAVFTDFNPFWQFIAGPFHTRARRPHRLDRTFGPRAAFASTPEDLRGNHAPSAGYLYYGFGRIDGRTGALSVSLHDLAGTTLFRVELPAAGG
jgi:alkaline phosphatase D